MNVDVSAGGEMNNEDLDAFAQLVISARDAGNYRDNERYLAAVNPEALLDLIESLRIARLMAGWRGETDAQPLS